MNNIVSVMEKQIGQNQYSGQEEPVITSQQKEAESDSQQEQSTSDTEQEQSTLIPFNLDGLPPINIGALLMPAIWGPAHGIWITILYYPIWLLCDNLFYGVYQNPQPLTVVFAVLAALILAGATIVFARVSQIYALRRNLERGKTKEQYRKRQIAWAIAMAIVAVIMLAAATYYNLVIRPTLGA